MYQGIIIVFSVRRAFCVCCSGTIRRCASQRSRKRRSFPRCRRSLVSLLATSSSHSRQPFRSGSSDSRWRWRCACSDGHGSAVTLSRGWNPWMSLQRKTAGPVALRVVTRQSPPRLRDDVVVREQSQLHAAVRRSTAEVMLDQAFVVRSRQTYFCDTESFSRAALLARHLSRGKSLRNGYRPAPAVISSDLPRALRGAAARKGSTPCSCRETPQHAPAFLSQNSCDLAVCPLQQRHRPE